MGWLCIIMHALILISSPESLGDQIHLFSNRVNKER